MVTWVTYMGLLVEMANSIGQEITPVHPVAYIQMPVPKDRTDEAYFRSLKDLELPDSKLFLGLVHPYDETGTKVRLKIAQAVYPHIAGISTECEMGRATSQDMHSILEICAGIVG